MSLTLPVCAISAVVVGQAILPAAAFQAAFSAMRESLHPASAGAAEVLDHLGRRSDEMKDCASIDGEPLMQSAGLRGSASGRAGAMFPANASHRLNCALCLPILPSYSPH
jgi:hypothetical protein